MKSRMPLFIGVVVVALVIGAWMARSQSGSTAAPTTRTAAPPGAAPEGPVVHTFRNEEALRDFAGLWQARQTIVIRMQVLRSYWDREQALLAETNGQLNDQYDLDPTQNYTLNAEARTLVSRPDVAEGDEPPPLEEGTVVHTFKDEEAMQAFAELWQLRQAILLRSRVLEAYWRNEQGALQQANDQLAETYELDPEKNYFLDGQRRVIVEVEGTPEAPPAPPAPVEAPAEEAPVAP